MVRDMQTRDASLDAVRIMGILAVVAGHTLTSKAVWLATYTWHVPLFFVLSGYLWTGGRSVRAEILRRIDTLMKPYVFWLGTLYLLYVFELFAFDEPNKGQILGPLYGGRYTPPPFTTFYFVSVLFAVTILWRLLEASPLTVRAIAIGVALGSSLLLGPELSRTPLAFGSAVPALMFVAAGQALRRVKFRTRTTQVGVAISMLAGSAALVVSGGSRPLDIKAGDWGTPVLSVVVAIAISWALILIAHAIVPTFRRASDAITTIALAGLVVVLFHPAIIWVTGPTDLPEIVTFALALVVPGTVGLIAMRSRLSPWASGIQRRSARVGTG